MGPNNNKPALKEPHLMEKARLLLLTSPQTGPEIRMATERACLETVKGLLSGVNQGLRGPVVRPGPRRGHGCLGNGPAVYFVAGSRLTLLWKCSFPTMRKDPSLWCP